jgi:hypothetical protein
MTSRLHQLSALGQSVWIDFLSRELLESGALARTVAGDAVVGVTSNPTIFAKALSEAERTTSRSRSRAATLGTVTETRTSSGRRAEKNRPAPRRVQMSTPRAGVVQRLGRRRALPQMQVRFLLPAFTAPGRDPL